MSALTATVAETRANFSRIAAAVNATGKPVTVFKNSKPFVVIAPAQSEYSEISSVMDSVLADPVPIDKTYGHAILPQEWDDPGNDGVYDDLA